MISLKLRTVHGLLFAMGNTLHADSQRQSGIALEVGVSFIIEALPGGGWDVLPVRILKRLVSVFINACRLWSALPSLSQFGRGRL